MDAALLLAALASRAGDRVDLLAMDRRVRARVEGAPRTELLPRLVQAMAPLEADLVEADWTAIVGAVRSPADPARAGRAAHPAGVGGTRGGAAAR